MADHPETRDTSKEPWKSNSSLSNPPNNAHGDTSEGYSYDHAVTAHINNGRTTENVSLTSSELAQRLQNSRRTQKEPESFPRIAPELTSTGGSSNDTAITIPIRSLVQQAEAKNDNVSQNQSREEKRRQLRELLQQQQAAISARTQSTPVTPTYNSPYRPTLMSGMGDPSSNIPASLSGEPRANVQQEGMLSQEVVTNSLYADPVHLARLALLGVHVPPELIPTGLRHTVPQPSKGVDPNGNPKSESVRSEFPSALARPVVSTEMQVNPTDIVSQQRPEEYQSIASQAIELQRMQQKMQQHQHSADPGAASPYGIPPNLNSNVASSYPSKLPPLQGNPNTASANDMKMMNYLRHPGYQLGETKLHAQRDNPVESAVYVESNDGGSFKRMTGWIDPALGEHHSEFKRQYMGASYETPEQRAARLQRQRAEQLSIMYSEGTNSLQRLLLFVFLLCCGFWCGVTLLQVYWGQNRLSHAAFIQGYAPVAEPIYACNMVIAILVCVFSIWFFYLEIFSRNRRFSLVGDWEWQGQINIIMVLGSFVALFATASASDVDALMLHYYDTQPNWFTNLALLDSYVGRLNRWHAVCIVRFISVLIVWILCAYKFAFGHTINPNLPEQAQRRMVRSVLLPDTVQMSHVAAALHVEEHPLQYARYFPHLLQDLLEHASSTDQAASLADGVALGVDSLGNRRAMVLDDEGKLVQPIPGSDNAHGLRSVFAFV